MAKTIDRTDPRLARSRAAITEAAADLLIENGVRGATVDAVVARSGVARSTIYRHFASRGELVAAAFDRLLPTPPPAPAAGPLEARLLAVVLPKANEMASLVYASLVPSLLSEAARDPELAEVHDRFVTAHQAPLTQVIVDAVTRGELAAGFDVDAACSALLGPSLFQHLILGRPPVPGTTERTVRAFVELHQLGSPGLPGPAASAGSDP